MGNARSISGMGRPRAPRFRQTKPRYLKMNSPARLRTTAAHSQNRRRGPSPSTIRPKNQLAAMEASSNTTFTGSPQA